MLRYQTFSGIQLGDHIDALAQLRIEVFREFPYLYDGDLQYEKGYLKTYTQSQNSLIVLVWDGDRAVGASTAIPLLEETAEVQQPFIDAGMELERLFYCGESVLLSDYRGQGVGVRFFELREQAARRGGFQQICFCAVQRPDDHPRKPAGYQPLDLFWQNRGYQKQPHLTTQFSWKDLDEEVESFKPMAYWLKEF